MTSERTRKRLVQQLMEEGICNNVVLEAMTKTPRHLFMDEALGQRAYENIALPIGYSQTISQPYLVARMTEALLAGQKSIGKVLEIGTGSGYQSALLSLFTEDVFTVDRIKPLIAHAKKRFSDLQLRNIHLRYSNGYEGWKEHGPYEGIIVNAAPMQVPIKLIEQLAEGGRLVIPVGDSNSQSLQVITKMKQSFNQIQLGPVRFGPMLEGIE